jgi:hypothetical protein
MGKLCTHSPTLRNAIRESVLERTGKKKKILWKVKAEYRK